MQKWRQFAQVSEALSANYINLTGVTRRPYNRPKINPYYNEKKTK